MLENKVFGAMYALLLATGIFSYANLITASDYQTSDTRSHGSWTSLADVPYSGIGYGGDLAWTGGDYIYAFVGMNTPLFFRYSISGDSWQQMQNVLTSVGPGGSLVWAGGDYIYAFTGGGSGYFFRYTISTDSWQPMPPYPGPSIAYGADLEWTGGDYIYAFLGYNAGYFFRYSISGYSWKRMRDTFPQGYGADLAWTGGNYIYGFRGGNTPPFYRYDISLDSWAGLATCPYYVHYGGSLEWVGGDYICAFPGYNTQHFLRYNVSGGNWAPMENVPQPVYVGGCLEYADRYIYAFTGNNRPYFWRFALADVAVTDVAVSDTVVQEGQMVNVTVIVENEGLTTETFNVTAYYDAEVIGEQTVEDLLPEQQKELTFVWNTSGLASDMYTISAVADTVEDEVDVGDNTFIDGDVVIYVFHVYWTPMCPFPLENSSIPREWEPVNVTADLTFNGSTPDAVDLSYRVNAGAWWNTTMSYNTTMWTNIIPGQAGNSTVEFFLTVHAEGHEIITSIYGWVVSDYEYAYADVNGDGYIDMKDVGRVARLFGQ